MEPTEFTLYFSRRVKNEVKSEPGGDPGDYSDQPTPAKRMKMEEPSS